MNADPIAAHYRRIERLAFGRALERCRFAQLPRIRDARRVLILGEGDGRFLEALLRNAPEAMTVDVIDSSAAMLKLAETRVKGIAGHAVRFLQRDALSQTLPGSDYDAVVTNFFLDCLSHAETRQLVENLSVALRTDGMWVIGEFEQHATGSALRAMNSKIWVRTMYTFFRLATGLRVRDIPDYRPLLIRAGFVRLQQSHQRFGLIVSELWQKTSRSA